MNTFHIQNHQPFIIQEPLLLQDLNHAVDDDQHINADHDNDDQHHNHLLCKTSSPPPLIKGASPSLHGVTLIRNILAFVIIIVI